MPFKSERQRKYLFAKHPEIAKRWVAEGKGYVVKRRTRKRNKKGTRG